VVGGVAVLDTARRVLITTTGDESSRTFKITGTDPNGTAISEIVQGPNATTAQSALDYKTVTSIVLSGAAAAALTVGTSGVASSRWFRLDGWAPAPVGLQCTVTGTVNYTVQQTFQDPNDPTNPVLPYLVNWQSSLDPAVVDATTTQVSYMPNAPTWVKVTLNSGTGSVSASFTQNGSVTY
jgi:hypothetical protein